MYLSGESILKEPLKYSFNYRNHKRGTGGKLFPIVINNTILISNDKINYALFNVIQNKEITPMKYSSIEVRPFYKNRFLYPLVEEAIGYKASIEDIVTIINFEGKEMIPPMLNDIISYYTLDEKNYAYGKTNINGKESLNLIDLTTKQYVFSENLSLKIKNIKPINKGIWALELNDNTKTKTGIYDINKQEFIIKPNEK